VSWRKLHAWAAVVWVAAIVIQVILAGLAIANLGGSGDFTTHAGVGYTIGIVQLIALVLAFPAKASRRDKAISLGLLVLYIVQTVLPAFKGVVAALHPLNAMLLFTLSVWYAGHAWQLAAAPDGAGASTVPAEASANVG
jgi:hypothetical protein